MQNNKILLPGKNKTCRMIMILPCDYGTDVDNDNGSEFGKQFNVIIINNVKMARKYIQHYSPAFLLTCISGSTVNVELDA